MVTKHQGPLVVRQSWETPGVLGVSKSMKRDTFSLQCFKTVGVG